MNLNDVHILLNIIDPHSTNPDVPSALNIIEEEHNNELNTDKIPSEEQESELSTNRLA